MSTDTTSPHRTHSGPRRRRTRRHPARRRRRRLLRALAVIGGLVAIGTVVLAVDVAAARGALEQARQDLRAAQEALAAGEVGVAVGRLSEARERIDRADAATNRQLWRAGEVIPLAGRSLTVVRAVVDVADAAVDVGQQAVEQAGELLAERDLGLRVQAGRVDLEPLREAADRLDAIDAGSLAAARSALQSSPDRWLPGAVRDGRREALLLADQALGTLQRARLLLAALPGFLGADGERAYFLAMQNNAELRGTGGLLGQYAVLRVSDGSLTLEEVHPIRDLDQDRSGRLNSEVDAPPEFAARYGHAGGASFLRSVNLDPDLPTVAPVLLDLYAQRTGERLDGVVAADPVGLSAILGPIGPVDLAAEATTGTTLPDPVPPDRIPELTMIDAVRAFDANDERKEFLAYLAEGAFARLLAGDWDPVPVTRGIATTAAARHLQLYSTDAGEQGVFRTLGVAGAVDAAAGGDLLAVTAVNAAGNKQDVHVGHRLEGTVRLSPPEHAARRDGTVRVSLDNPLPPAGPDTTILGSLPTDSGVGDQPLQVNGLNRTWFTVWLPDSATVEAARTGTGAPLDSSTWAIHGHHALDHFLETPAESTSAFETDFSGPVDYVREGPDLVYRLTLWHQAKAVPDRVDLTITAPEGWDVAGAQVLGGGDGGGLGMFGEQGPAVTATVEGEGRRVRVAGDVSADLTVELRFSRSLVDRLVDWLSASAW